MIKIIDKSKDGVYSSNMELVDNFLDYSSKNLDFDKPVEVELMDDEKNAKNPLGATAYYDADQMKIVIYVTGRHLKDILRSLSHELIHHVQNCRGDLDRVKDTQAGYAQRDSHMRDMEHEAYTKGNIMNFRDFEDTYKKGNKQMKTSLKELKKIINEEVEAVITEQGAATAFAALFGKGKQSKGDPSLVKDKFAKQAVEFIIDQLHYSRYISDEEEDQILARLRGIVARAKRDSNIAKQFVDFYRSKQPSESRDPQNLDRQLRLRLGFKNRTTASALAGQLIKLAAAPVGKKADQAQAATAAGPAAPARAASRRCPRKTTIAIQTKLNALGYKLKPTRKAKDGVDGAFGGDTYAKLKLALGKGAGRNKFVASRNCKKLLTLLQKAKPFAGAAPKATTAGPAPATPTPISGISDNLLFKIRTIADREVQDALSRSTAFRNVEAKNINKIRTNYREQIVKNVAQQFIDKKLKGELQIQGAVKKLVLALAQQMDKEAANIKEGIETNFDEFTKTLNEHKNNKLDDRFKKLVKTFKK